MRVRDQSRWIVSLAIALTSVALVACSNDGVGDTDDEHAHDSVPDESLGQVTSALVDSDPVSSAVTQSCSTAVVKGLSTQLVEEIQCLKPGTMKRIDGTA